VATNTKQLNIATVSLIKIKPPPVSGRKPVVNPTVGYYQVALQTGRRAAKKTLSAE
jgi:hypothetical protein